MTPDRAGSGTGEDTRRLAASRIGAVVQKFHAGSGRDGRHGSRHAGSVTSAHL